MTVPELAARLFMFPVTGTSLSAEDAAWLGSVKPGGVILVEGNFGGPEEIRSLVASIHATNPGLPPLVALDQEGGIVSRIADDPAPDAPALGQLPRAEIATFARMRADSLAAYGFNVNFAPVADVAFSRESFMSARAFGDDPEIVAGDVAAYVEGTAGSGVLHCVKHFPGHGRVTLDSHEALPTLVTDEAAWRETDALPFQAAIDVGVPMVMLGHLVARMWDELPATLSPAAITYLRDVMGFAGVIATDDLLMGALTNWDAYTIVDLALAAGVDLLLYVGLPDSPEALVGHVLNNVEQGRISVDRLMTSVRRLLHVSLEWA